jgi:phenylacetate-CoA ligase
VSELEPPAPNESPDGDAIGRAVSERIKDLIGVSARVHVVAPGTLERSAGKAKRVIDLRSL